MESQLLVAAFPWREFNTFIFQPTLEFVVLHQHPCCGRLATQLINIYVEVNTNVQLKDEENLIGLGVPRTEQCIKSKRGIVRA